MKTTRYVILFVALTLIISGASATRDSLQGDADVTWGTYAEIVTLGEYWADGNYALYFSESAPGAGGEAGITYPSTGNIEYIAYTYYMPASNGYFKIRLRDKDYNLLATSSYFEPITGTNRHRLELVYDSSAEAFKCYIDGDYFTTITLNYFSDARYFSIYVIQWAHVDDVIVGSKTPAYIVSTVPPSWYILNDTVTPRTQGLYNSGDALIDEQYINYMYGASSTAISGDLRTPDRIVTSHWDTGEVVNITDLPDDTYHGILKIDFKSMLMDPQKPFGIYQIKLYRSDNTLMDVYNFKYLPEIPGGYHISWDKPLYMGTDTAIINTTIEDFNIDDYTYKGLIKDINGNLVYDWTISTGTAEETVEINNWDAGTYYTTINLIDLGTGGSFDIAYDITEVTNEVAMAGTVYNVETGATLDAADVVNYQAGSWFNTTSAADGSYNLTDMIVDYPVTVMAAKTGYDHNGYDFTPLDSKEYDIDIYMYPDDITYTGDAAIAGMTYRDLYHQAIAGANVTICNDTWTGYATTSDTGYFIENNLIPNSTYTVSGTATGYFPSDEYTVNTTTGVTIQDVEFSGTYALTVDIRDGNTHTPIVETVSLGLTGTGVDKTGTTTTGDYTFTGLNAGLYTVSAAAEGYYGDTSNIYLDENKTTIMYLNEKTESEPFAYPPHNVKFTLRSAFGGTVPGATVTATGYETTMGSWGWLLNMLGITEEKTPIEGTEMTGETGSDGAINFMMIESVKYRVNFYKEGEFNVTWDGYPKDEYYEVWTSPFGPGEWYETGYNPLSVISFAVTNATSDADATNIEVAYNDTLDNTTSATVDLDRRLANGTEINIDSYSNSGATWNHTFTLTGDHRDEDYYIRLYSDHGDLGNVTREIGIHTKPGPTAMGLPEDLLLWFAMGIMVFTALFFGQTSVNAGTVVFALEGWIFYWLGWIQDLGSDTILVTTLSVITFVAVLYNIMHRSKRERYA